MAIILAGLFAFAVLTLWIPAEWPVAVFEIGIFVLAAIALLRVRRQPPPFCWPLVPLSFAVLWGVFQLLSGRTAYPFDTANAVVRWTTFLAVYFLGISLVQSSHIRRRFLTFMLWFGFLVSVLATLQTFTSGGRVFWLFPTAYADYVMGPILSRNHYAAFIEVVLPIALYLALRRPTRTWLYSGMAAAMYASVIASASRAGACLATAELVAVPLILWLLGRTAGPAARHSMFRMALLLVVFTAVVGPETVWKRFWEPDPYAVRREFAISSLQMVADHPWTGTGLGTWPTVYPRYAIIDVGGSANQAHSDWLQWTAEGGIPFAFIMLTLFAWSLRPAFRSVWGIGVISVFLHAAVDYPFSRPALGSWAIVLAALISQVRTGIDEGMHPEVHIPKSPAEKDISI